MQRHFISSQNQHIRVFLDYYCGLTGSPEYAILIKGPWGSGKSRFIRGFLDELERKGKKSLYASLYGVSSIDDIESEFFRQLHPILASKGAKMLGKLFKVIIRASIKVDLDGDGSPDGNITVRAPDDSFVKAMQSPDGRVLVFDDVERCSLPIAMVLGYINSFVEHSGLKVILVANEEEILVQDGRTDDAKTNDTTKKQLGNTYERIKEKLIGKTFEITPETEAALNSFIEQIQCHRASRIVSDNKSMLIDLYHKSGYKNLRVLKHSVLEFERMFETLSQSIKDAGNKSFELQLLTLFLVYSFEIQNAKLRADEISKLGNILSAYINPGNSSNGDPKLNKIRDIKTRYNDVDLNETIFDVSIWIEWFATGYIKSDAISEAVLSSKYFSSASQPKWIQLWHAEDLTDSEYPQILREVMDDWERKTFTDVGVVKHIAGSLLWLSDAGLYNDTHDNILISAKEYVDYLKQSGHLMPSDEDSSLFSDNTSWHGLSFRSGDKPHFTQLLAYIAEKQNEARMDSYPTEAKKLLGRIKEDTAYFSRALMLSNHQDNRFFNIPILSYMNPADFVQALLELPQDKKRQVGRALQERYKVIEFRQRLSSEKDFLIQIADSLSLYSKSNAGTMSGYTVSSFVEHCVQPAIEILNQHDVDIV